MEILVYISVFAIIFLSVYSFLTWTIKSNDRIRAIREVTDNARRALEVMTYEIREAGGVYTPTSSTTQLSLETSHYLPQGESSTFVDFYLCGNNADVICLKKESQNPTAITSDRVQVSGLEFLQISTTTPAIRIKLKIDYDGLASINSTSTVSLRNY